MALILIGAAVGAGSAAIPSEFRPAGQLVVIGLGLVLVIWWVLLPFLRWRTTTYTITTRRLITRSGILNKIGKDLPLNRINEVSSERSLTDRMFRCGTLNVQTAADDGTIVLVDVPDVEQVRREMTELLPAARPVGHPAHRLRADDRRGRRLDRPTGKPRRRVIMNRPEALNALQTGQARLLIDAYAELADDPQLSVVVITSASDRAFCVGADLKERAGFDDDDLRAQRPVFVAAFGGLLNLAVPTITADRRIRPWRRMRAGAVLRRDQSPRRRRRSHCPRSVSD